MTFKLTVETADPALIAQIAAILPKDTQPTVTALPTANAAQIPAAPSTPAQPSAPIPQALPTAAPVIPAAQTAPALPTAQTAAPTVQQMFGAPAQQPPIPAALPQAAQQTYTVQELGLAARPLVEMGRQNDLMALLAEFGAPSVAELPENMRPAFAAKLRAMGGQI